MYTAPCTQHHVHSTMYTAPCTQHHVHSTIYTAPSTQHRAKENLTESSSSNKSSDFFSSAKALALENPTTFKMRHEKYSKHAGREACMKQQRQRTCWGGSHTIRSTKPVQISEGRNVESTTPRLRPPCVPLRVSKKDERAIAHVKNVSLRYSLKGTTVLRANTKNGSNRSSRHHASN